jgi:hypothetical protein
MLFSIAPRRRGAIASRRRRWGTRKKAKTISASSRDQCVALDESLPPDEPEPLEPLEPLEPEAPLAPEAPLVPDELPEPLIPLPLEPLDPLAPLLPLAPLGVVMIVVLCCCPAFQGCQTNSATIAATTMIPMTATDATLAPPLFSLT